jgi:hypothetical protein
MFRKQVSPKVAAIGFVLILAGIQFAYWRALVYRPPNPPPNPMGSGGGMRLIPYATGFEEVRVETVSGDSPGFQDGKAWEARFCGPNALAAGPEGVLWVCDSRNHRIRRIQRGEVTTVAGGGEPGGPGGGGEGPAGEARFRYPSGVAAEPDGTLYVADTGNHRLCVVREGRVSTLAGAEGAPGRADGAGPAARFRFPAALWLDGEGGLWVADIGNGVLRRVAVRGAGRGSVTTPATPPAAARSALGELRPERDRITILAPPEGRGVPGPTQFKLGYRAPGSAVVGQWRLYPDPEYHTIMAGAPGTPALLVAGRRLEGLSSSGNTDGEGSRSTFSGPCATVLGSDGAVYVAEYEGSRIRRLRLPAWLLAGAAEPPPPPRRPGRMPRGS